VAIHEGRPHVTASGVQLWHAACWDQRDVPIARAIELPVDEPVVLAARGSRRKWLAALVAPATVLAIGLGRTGSGNVDAADAAAAATIDVGDDAELTTSRFAIAGHDDAAPPPAIAVAEPELDTGSGSDADATDAPAPSLDEQFPTLATWVHPVLAARELYPPQEVRHFGAARKGVTRAECGQGHCGIDLDGPRGQPIVAVAAGTLVRVERHELGLDGRSGRYVRIQHEDGTLTAYMHLDIVAEGLHVGDRVSAGQVIGTLGATACYSAPAHLHFSLEVPTRPTEHGDITDTRYVDPGPYLQRATVVEQSSTEASVRHVAS
jgi:murein DD-endopeptidase MepM/ murein hydrolase activator NlpD